jgi:uncharacterized protein YukE
MLAGAGGGSISVEPAAIQAMAARVSVIAGSTSSVHGSVGSAADAAAGCKDPAAAAFARMQLTVLSALAALDDCSTMLSQAVANGAQAYVTTDDTQMPGAQLSSPANP